MPLLALGLYNFISSKTSSKIEFISIKARGSLQCLSGARVYNAHIFFCLVLDGPLTGEWELSLWHILKKLDRVFSCNIQTRSGLKEFKAPIFNILWLLRSDFHMSFASVIFVFCS